MGPYGDAYHLEWCASTGHKALAPTQAWALYKPGPSTRLDAEFPTFAKIQQAWARMAPGLRVLKGQHQVTQGRLAPGSPGLVNIFHYPDILGQQWHQGIGNEGPAPG